MAMENELVCLGLYTNEGGLVSGVSKANKNRDFWVYKKLPVRPGDVEGQLAHLGTVKEVRTMVENSIDVIWRGPFWCVYKGEDFEIEFDVGGIASKESDVLDSINVVVKGMGDPLPVLAEFSRANKLTLCDLSTGEELEFFHPAGQQWMMIQDVIDNAVDHMKSSRYTQAQNEPMSLPGPTSTQDENISIYRYFWANPGHDQYNFIALEGNELLIGKVALPVLEDFVEQYKRKRKVQISKNSLELGSQRRRLTGLIEMNDHLNTPKCELVFHGSEVPTEIVFSSPLAKNRFIEVALGRIPRPKKTFEAEKILEGINIPLLIFTLLFTAGALFWPTKILLGLSILCGLATVIPLMKYFITGPQMYEVYSFSE